MAERTVTRQQGWTPAKLKFIKADGSEGLLEEYVFDFNPKDYSISRGAVWNAPQAKSGVLPALYAGPTQSSVTIEVFLDASNKADGDITPWINKFLMYMTPDHPALQQSASAANVSTAALVIFIWGDKILFKGYLKQCAVKYTLFRASGMPIRGSATLTIEEFKPALKETNPTSGSEPGTRQHKVVAGDSLASIAYREYGSAAGWRRIADANAFVDDPLRLQAGRNLIVPPAF